MPLYEVIEVTRYRLYASSQAEAIDVLVQADEPDEFFHSVDAREAREIGENE